MSLADGRRRLIERDGRPMILRRITNGAPVSVTLMGKHTAFLPQELTGAVRQGDVRIAVGQDEIAAAGWPTPMRSPDEISIDGKTFTIQGAVPVYEGSTLIGWKIHARGGQ